MTAAVAQPASALHLPRNRDGPDTRLLNRASRLSAVANAVGAIDLKQDGRGASSWWQGSSRSDSSSQSNRAASPVPWRVASTGDGNNNNNNNSNNNNYNNSNNNNYNNNYNDNNYNNNNNNNNNNGVGKRASSPAGRRSGGESQETVTLTIKNCQPGRSQPWGPVSLGQWGPFELAASRKHHCDDPP
ncbi:unnamed protein product [Polarella glacialis]|uniref:Uncharacterized protein n=1 Tax=Polarella glacialis TaxID=89957 RepID=A0A813F823_POLGL|nr:unnamed protein product [Polarella glacialis]